ncbi:hypothetical protein JMJ35_004617 [Cladonia borealis]|uniref:protein-ribulosamine 3-kinase n=1 Tax=Cladonia borealis TaxID=184061 RepID=A0AA39R2K5_9LECA|nr:hypothetical protein JMJ35_004617 [Cladonia borealis]
MSKTVHELMNNENVAASHSLTGIQGDFPIDEAVLDAMPKGTKVISAEAYGHSVWTTTGEITTILPDGTTKRYFLKCASEDHGKTMMFGEYTSVTKIHSLIPDLVPAPYCWGQYISGSPDTYFFLSDFVDMDHAAPDPTRFTARLAELHCKSKSPNGMFGFEVTTCDGKLPHTVAWEKSWATFFGKILRGVLKLDIEASGVWPELEAAAEQVLASVIPRLLGILQSDGRELKPSLIHGDCWEGNVGTVLETGDVILCDAGSYYAHNEMELGIWRCQWGQHFRKRVYSESYRDNYEAADPAQEWDDRNRLYSLKYNLNYSGGHPGSITRQTAYNDMCYLCEKYAPLEGLGKYDGEKDPSVTGAHILGLGGEELGLYDGADEMDPNRTIPTSARLRAASSSVRLARLAQSGVLELEDGRLKRTFGQPLISTRYFCPHSITRRTTTMTTIVIRMLDNSNHTYENILPGTTVAALKQRVAERQGIPITAQKLIYGGAFLEDGNTLDSYNIAEGFVLRLLTTVTPSTTTVVTTTSSASRVLKNVFIQPAQGPVMSIHDVPFDATVQHLKNMYFYKTTQDPQHIRLIYAGKELEDVRNGRGKR